jgi:hypothetical protein
MRHLHTFREQWEQRLMANRLRCTANSIGIIPSSTPGDFTVGGNLTVNGGLVKIRSNTYYVRLGNIGGSDGWSVNKASDLLGLDDAALAGTIMGFDPTNGRCGGTLLHPGGADQIWHRGAELFADMGFHQITGDTLEHTLYSMFLRADALAGGGQGSLKLRINGSGTTAAASNITMRLKLDSTTEASFIIGASVTNKNWVIDLDLWGDGTNDFVVAGIFATDAVVPTIVNVGSSGFVASAAHTLTFTTQASASGNSLTANSCLLEQWNTH